MSLIYIQSELHIFQIELKCFFLNTEKLNQVKSSQVKISPEERNEKKRVLQSCEPTWQVLWLLLFLSKIPIQNLIHPTFLKKKLFSASESEEHLSH